jgi:hypothetical protein
MTKNKTTLSKRIEFLENAFENKLTKETINNLANIIRQELIAEEKYEYCAVIDKIEKFQLKQLALDKKSLISNVGLKKEEMDRLFNSIILS